MLYNVLLTSCSWNGHQVVEATPAQGKQLLQSQLFQTKEARAFWRWDWAQFLKARALLRHKGSRIHLLADSDAADSSLTPYKTPSTHLTKALCGELGNCLSSKVRPSEEFPNHRPLHMSQQQSEVWAQPAEWFTLCLLPSAMIEMLPGLTTLPLGASVQKTNFLCKTMHKHFHAIFAKIK